MVGSNSRIIVNTTIGHRRYLLLDDSRTEHHLYPGFIKGYEKIHSTSKIPIEPEFIHFYSSYEAVQFIERGQGLRKKDTWLLDYMLDGLNGLEIYGLLKQKSFSGEAILVTGGGDDKTIIDEALVSGIDAILRKPFKPEELIRCLDRVRFQ